MKSFTSANERCKILINNESLLKEEAPLEIKQADERFRKMLDDLCGGVANLLELLTIMPPLVEPVKADFDKILKEALFAAMASYIATKAKGDSDTKDLLDGILGGNDGGE